MSSSWPSARTTPCAPRTSRRCGTTSTPSSRGSRRQERKCSWRGWKCRPTTARATRGTFASCTSRWRASAAWPSCPSCSAASQATPRSISSTAFTPPPSATASSSTGSGPTSSPSSPVQAAEKGPSASLTPHARTLNVQRVRLACGHGASPRMWTLLSRLQLVAAAAHEAEKKKEEVFEVEIERQGAQDGIGAELVLGDRGGHLAEALGVPRREPREHDDPHHGDQELQGGILPEHTHHRGEDETDESHEDELAHTGEASRGRGAVEGEGTEHPRCHHEGGGDGRARVGEEDDGQGDAGEGGIEDEEPGGRTGRQTIDASGQEEDDAELGEEETKEDEVIRDESSDESGGRRDRVGHEGGDTKTHAHPSVDGAEETGDALSRGGGCGEG